MVRVSETVSTARPSAGGAESRCWATAWLMSDLSFCSSARLSIRLRVPGPGLPHFDRSPAFPPRRLPGPERSRQCVTRPRPARRAVTAGIVPATGSAPCPVGSQNLAYGIGRTLVSRWIAIRGHRRDFRAQGRREKRTPSDCRPGPCWLRAANATPCSIVRLTPHLECGPDVPFPDRARAAGLAGLDPDARPGLDHEFPGRGEHSHPDPEPRPPTAWSAPHRCGWETAYRARPDC